ncbi:MAG: hypothetical protein H0T46_23025 [Deltaproteobacteria bacterium]|nr:hypothetical protein [Deltaproteobacteria bacterium]
MSDFKDAFKRGLGASQRADTLRAEAESTIADFGRQVREASGEKVHVYLDETWIEKSRKFTRGVMATMLGTSDHDGAKKTHALFARVSVGKVSGGQEVLCVLTFSPGTYPIELGWETEVRVCADKTELVYGLESMLEDPRIGKKFRGLIATYPSIAERAAKAEQEAATKLLTPGTEGQGQGE